MSTTVAPRVGLFGLLGAGNLGNDGSMEAVLAYLHAQHPDAIIDFFCSGPEQITARYGFPATRLHWNRGEYQTAASLRGAAAKGVGKLVDAFRTWRWVAAHDVVIVPGMGVLEATLPLRPWGFPYSLLLLTASGRLTGTQVALVSVGANTAGNRWTRRVFTWAARLASYRSFRDELSRTAMASTGLDVSTDKVFPDLVFSLPDPPETGTSTGTVGVGVMFYHGTDADRHRADEVHRTYVDKLRTFTRWLVDTGHRVRLFVGDGADEVVAQELVDDLRAYRPGAPDTVVAEPIASLSELMRQMTLVDAVVATRYHNVLCAVKLGKPTLSIGYSTKNDVLMDERGLSEFCQDIRELDVELLMDQFDKLESRSDELGAEMERENAIGAREAARQFEILSSTLFDGR